MTDRQDSEQRGVMIEMVEACQSDVLRVLHARYEEFPATVIHALLELTGQLVLGAARSAPATLPVLLDKIDHLRRHVEAGAIPAGRQMLH